MEIIVKEINNAASTFIFLEFSILSYSNGNLVLAASEDFLYYHNFEIHFQNVFSIIGNINWKMNSQKKAIEIINKTKESFSLNKNYKIETGYNIYAFTSEDEVSNYIVAENIFFKNELVKYAPIS